MNKLFYGVIIFFILLVVVLTNDKFFYYNTIVIFNGNKEIKTNDMIGTNSSGYFIYKINWVDDYDFKLFTDRCAYATIKKYQVTKEKVVYSDNTEFIFVHTNCVGSYAFHYVYYRHKLNEGIRKGIFIDLCNKRDILVRDK